MSPERPDPGALPQNPIAPIRNTPCYFSRDPGASFSKGFASNLHLGNFLERVHIEYKLLKVSSHHIMYSVSFFLVIAWTCSSLSSVRAFSGQQDMRQIVGLSPGSYAFNFNEYIKWLNDLKQSFQSTNPVLDLALLVRGTKFMVEPCSSTGYSKRSRISSSRLTKESSCISDADAIVLESICDSNETCSLTCVADSIEVAAVRCLIQDPQSENITTNDFVILGMNSTSLAAVENPQLIKSVFAVLVVNVSAVNVKIVVAQFDSPSQFTVSYVSLHSTRDELLPLICGVVVLLAIVISMDIRYLLRKRALDRPLKLFGNLRVCFPAAVILIVCIRWIYFKSYLDNSLRMFYSIDRVVDSQEYVEGVDTLMMCRSWKNVVDCVTFGLTMFASLRLLNMLSAHPKTAILYRIIFMRKREFIKAFVSLTLLYAHFMLVRCLVMGDRHSVQVFQWLVQVPVGVWPMTNDNVLFLLLFGLLTFHFMVVLFQVIVHAGFKEFKTMACPAAQAFHVDVWYLCKRFIARRLWSKRCWPDRLILIYALECIRDRRPPTERGCVTLSELHEELCNIKANSSGVCEETEAADPITAKHKAKLLMFYQSEISVLDPDSIEEIWEWYYNEFGIGFLAPDTVNRPHSNPDDVSINEIMQYVGGLQQHQSSTVDVEQSVLPTLDEIRARTTQLNSLIHRLD